MTVHENSLELGRIVWAQQGNNDPELFVITNASGSATTLGAPISRDVLNQLQAGTTPNVSINPSGISDIEGRIEPTGHYLGHDQILLAARRGARALFEEEDYSPEVAALIVESTIAEFEASLAEAIKQEEKIGGRRSIDSSI